MPLDASTFEGGAYGSPWCRACREPIREDQPATRVAFQTDPHGENGLTGDYHVACSKPFVGLARVINLNPWSGW
jgi:hypothetical protein